MPGFVHVSRRKTSPPCRERWKGVGMFYLGWFALVSQGRGEIPVLVNTTQNNNARANYKRQKTWGRRSQFVSCSGSEPRAVTLAPRKANVSKLDHLNPTRWVWLMRNVRFNAVCACARALPGASRDMQTFCSVRTLVLLLVHFLFFIKAF